MMHAAFPARVVIVGKTRMGQAACIGGIIDPIGKPVRLLPRGKYCHPPETPFQVGDVWTMQLRPRPDLEPPHTEDHDEWDARRVGPMPKFEEYLARAVRPHAGGIDGLFGGMLVRRTTGSAYLPRNNPLPAWSVEFWTLPHNLRFEIAAGRARYRTADGLFRVPHVGFQPPVTMLPAGTLVRMSLARWWVNPECPSEGQTCSLQLSGWFGLGSAAPAPMPQVHKLDIREEDVPF
jgi:ATP-dependent DNA helicase RecQ